MGVAIGVDSHKSSLAVGVLDEMGRTVGVREFPNDGRGHDSLIDWLDDNSPDRIIGIEGSGSYGAGLARRLIEAGEEVREVPAFMSHRERKKNPSRGKSDVNDAVAIAQVVARGKGLSSPQREAIYQDLKLLSDQLVRARTQLINRAHKDLVVSHPGYEKRIPKLNSKKNLKEARALLRGDQSVRAELIRDRVAEIRRLDDKIAGIEKQIAAKILGEIGDVGRLRSKGSFAMLTGTAPLEASSGRTKRHRLNRGGNRQLNYALYMMALARCRGDADTQAYMARLRTKGKSDKEAMRCLKRHLSNVVFRQLALDLRASQPGRLTT